MGFALYGFIGLIWFFGYIWFNGVRKPLWLPIGLVGYSLLWPFLLYAGYLKYKKFQKLLKPFKPWPFILFDKKVMLED